MGRRDGNKWKGPGLDAVVILNDQVLWTHFYNGCVSVLMEDGMGEGDNVTVLETRPAASWINHST